MVESKSVQKRLAIQAEAKRVTIQAVMAEGPAPGGSAKKRVFRFHDAEYAVWQAEAKRRQISLTAWIREACRRYLG